MDNNVDWNRIFFYVLGICEAQLRVILFLVPEQIIVINKYSEKKSCEILARISSSAHSKEENKTTEKLF